jgi:hypothetical protein
MDKLLGVATILTIAGILAVQAALTGALFWYDGQHRAEIRSFRARIVIGIVGLMLLLGGVWQDRSVGRTPEAEKLDSLKTRLDQIESDLRSERDFSFNSTLVSQLAEDQRSMIYRVSRAERDVADSKCLPTYVESQGEVSECRSVAASLWTVEVVVQLAQSVGDLKKALEQDLGVAIVFNPPDPDAQRHEGGHIVTVADELAVVFPDGAPKRLICQAREKFVAIVKANLVGAATSSVFMESSRQAASMSAIRVGVPFGRIFESYPRMTSDDWDHVCGKDMTEAGFRDWFAGKLDKYKKKPSGASG